MASESSKSHEEHPEERQDATMRYRQAAEDALQQLDWCIGYLHGIRKVRISRALARNGSYIRQHLMRQSEQPVPSQVADDGDAGN